MEELIEIYSERKITSIACKQEIHLTRHLQIFALFHASYFAVSTQGKLK